MWDEIKTLAVYFWDRPYTVPIVLGLLTGWWVVQLAVIARRDTKRTKWPPSTNYLLAGLSAALATFIACDPTLYTPRQVLATAGFTGLLCPAFWRLFLRLTENQKGLLGRLHWALRGERRIAKPRVQPLGQRSDDPNETWG